MAAARRKKTARTTPMGWSDVAAASTLALAAIMLFSAALYILKSALGIDLMAGPSPLHDILYNFALY